MKKKKKDNRPLCYVCLVFLILLLLLPPALRIFGKNLYVKEERKKDEVIVLICNRKNEAISSTFFNGTPQNINYSIVGDYSVKVDEKDETTSENSLMDIIRPFSQIEYNRNENKTIFKVKVSDLKEIRDYVVLFSTLENQQNYYNSQAFYCDKTVY